MQYGPVIPGRFVDRPNRFVAHVETSEGLQTVHVKNTGRCRELLIPGATVYLEKSKNSARKTAYDLIAVEKGSLLVNLDSQAPNQVFGEWVAEGGFLPDVQAIKREFTYGDSRLDFCLETPKGRHLVEVKGVTLENNGFARFPDAPTERGIKHIRELQKAVEQGLEASICFIVQMEGMRSVAPNDDTHPAFGQALREAAASGVNIRAFECSVTPDTLRISGEIPVVL